MGTGIIWMPKASVTPKWRSYPGTGHSHLTCSSLHHGSDPSVPKFQQRATASYMRDRLELPPTMTFSGSSSSMAAMKRFASGSPSSTP